MSKCGASKVMSASSTLCYHRRWHIQTPNWNYAVWVHGHSSRYYSSRHKTDTSSEWKSYICVVHMSSILRWLCNGWNTHAQEQQILWTIRHFYDLRFHYSNMSHTTHCRTGQRIMFCLWKEKKCSTREVVLKDLLQGINFKGWRNCSEDLTLMNFFSFVHHSSLCVQD